MNVLDKMVVVSGASSGIGAATARRLGAEGAKVILLARSQEKLDAVAMEIRDSGGEAFVYPVDLSRREEVQEMAKKILQERGTPDVIVNNAGAGIWKPIEETSLEEGEEMMAVPYLGAFYLTRMFLPEMIRRRSGHIVNITSLAAFVGVPGATAYTVARWAMRGFSQSLRADLRGTGIGVSLVAAGKVDSPYFDHNPGSEERIPRIATLPYIYPTLTEERVAKAIVKAIHRNRKEVILPFSMDLTLRFFRLFPGMLQSLVNTTGWKRG